MRDEDMNDEYFAKINAEAEEHDLAMQRDHEEMREEMRAEENAERERAEENAEIIREIEAEEEEGDAK